MRCQSKFNVNADKCLRCRKFWACLSHNRKKAKVKLKVTYDNIRKEEKKRK